MRVSWLIPVRDGARWLHNAVASALADSQSDDEVIVIDDGSRDDPAAVLPCDTRVRLLRQTPQGIASALEAGRAAACGEFLARLDADDEAIAGRLRLQLAVMQQDAQVAIVGGACELVGDAGVPPGVGMLAYVAWLNSVRDPERELYVECPLLHPAMLLRSRALAESGGWRDGGFPEDYELVLRLVHAGWRLATVPQAVVRVRDHAGRLSRTDARYAPEAFDRLRREALRRGPLSVPCRVILWCGKRAGKDWLRWLLAEGHDVPVIVDIGRSKSRLGVPVVPPEFLRTASCSLLLVAVGTRGARALIREKLLQIRPDWQEGREFLIVR
ncbi:MAG: glycosyltransferase family 2 protein [Planctomycetes bacterium]|nr:glycosyltransferase family 2 protein [Planctomycetota bacterium]